MGRDPIVYGSDFWSWLGEGLLGTYSKPLEQYFGTKLEAIGLSGPLVGMAAPVERVAVFDEARRAWDLKQVSKFMIRKKGESSFDMSESEYLISVMDRHEDWCTIICLVGGGQEINVGEG
jgi:hypothetical protein